MSLPLIRSASRPLMRRAKGPSPMFTHSPPHALLQLLWKVQWQHFFSFFLSPSCVLSLSPSCVLSFFSSISHTHYLSLYPSLSLSSRCGSALFTNTHRWHTDSQCAQLLTSVDPSLTCIWSRPSSSSFTCRLSSWVGLFSAALCSQPASAKPLLILHVEVSNEDVGFILSAAPLLNQAVMCQFVSLHSEVDSLTINCVNLE